MTPASSCRRARTFDLVVNLVAHRPPSGAWPHPLLALDAHTIVSGSEAALRRLVDRNGEAPLTSEPLERLLKQLSPSDLAVFVDLSPATLAAGKSSIAGWLDVWPAGKSQWHVLCQATAALGLAVPSSGPRRCELGLACSSESLAEKIRVDVREAGARRSPMLPSRIAALKGTLPPDKFPREAADQYKRLLDALLGPSARPAATRWTASFGSVSAGKSRGSWSRRWRPARARRPSAPIGWPPPERLTRAITAGCSAACCCMRRRRRRRSFPTGWPADRRR